MSSNPHKVYRFGQYSHDNIIANELKDEFKIPMSFLEYQEPGHNDVQKLLVQSEKIKLTGSGAGIPTLSKEGSKFDYYPTDDKREFVKIPLDDQPGAIALRADLQAADEWADTDELRVKLFGKRAKKYRYQSCIKTPKAADSDSEDEDDDPKKKKKGSTFKKTDFVKMKFNMRIDEKSNRTNVTRLLRKEGKKAVEVVAQTITDVANEIRFQSEIRFIYMYHNIMVFNKDHTYSLGFRLMSIEYTPAAKRTLDIANISFLPPIDGEEEESDDEADELEGPTAPAKKSVTPAKPVVKAKLDDSDSDEPEPEPEPEAEADSDSEPEEVPKKKSHKKKSKPVADSDSDEDIPVTPKKSKPSKPVSDSDNSESEEVVQPKKKSVKKQTSSSRHR